MSICCHMQTTWILKLTDWYATNMTNENKANFFISSYFFLASQPVYSFPYATISGPADEMMDHSHQEQRLRNV